MLRDQNTFVLDLLEEIDPEKFFKVAKKHYVEELKEYD
jgi:hypothetical protein